MSLQLLTPPAVEPVTLDGAKAHLKVDTSADDALITDLIAAARARAEWHLGRALITQGWMLWLDAWPAVIEVPLPPLQAVTSITAYALNDAATVLDPATWQVDASSAPARIALKANAAPPVNLRALNAVAVEFTAGYGNAAGDVPAPIREAILQMIADAYANRGDAKVEVSSAALARLAPYRIAKI